MGDALEPVSPEGRAAKAAPTPERNALPGVPHNVRPEGQSHGWAGKSPLRPKEDLESISGCAFKVYHVICFRHALRGKTAR